MQVRLYNNALHAQSRAMNENQLLVDMASRKQRPTVQHACMQYPMAASEAAAATPSLHCIAMMIMRLAGRFTSLLIFRSMAAKVPPSDDVTGWQTARAPCTWTSP